MLCFIIALSAIVSLESDDSYATDTEIGYLIIDGPKALVENEKPSWLNAAPTAPAGANYTVEYEGTYPLYNHSYGNDWGPDNAIIKGYYQLEVVFTPKTGYSFSDKDSIITEINGVDVDYYNVTDYGTDGNKRLVRYYFVVGDGIYWEKPYYQINNCTVGVPITPFTFESEFAHGGTAPYSFSKVSTNAEWLTVHQSGYVTGTPTTSSIGVTNIEIKVEDSSGKSTTFKLKIPAIYAKNEDTGTNIGNLSLSGPQTLVEGEKPSWLATNPTVPTGANYTAKYHGLHRHVPWYSEWTSADTIAKGYYCLSVTFTPNSGYSFINDYKMTAEIEGVDVYHYNITSSGSDKTNRLVYFYFTVGDEIFWEGSSYFISGVVGKSIDPITLNSGYAHGGTVPYSFSKVSGPDWLTVHPSGYITGIPTVASSTQKVTLKVTDSSSTPKSKEFEITIQTIYNPVKFTINFDSNGGSGSVPDKEFAGHYTLPTTCQFTPPTEKKFKGWATSADGEIITTSTYIVASNVTFFAIWEDLPKYTMTYNIGDGSGTPPTNGTKTHNIDYNVSSEKPLTKTGYTQVGWKLTGPSNNPSDAVTVYEGNESVNFYPVWKINTYAITWKLDNSTVLETDENIEYGSTPTYNGELPTKPADDTYYYTFDGWNPTVAETVTGDATYTAKFKSVEKASHTHNYVSTWTSDSTGHWHACECGDKKDFSTHDTVADNGDCTSPVKCSCGYTLIEAKISHSGGTATCTEKAKCVICNKEYGEKNSAHHSGTTTKIVPNNDGTHDIAYTCCDFVKGDNIECSGTEYAYDADAHSLKCATCNTSYGSKFPHEMDDNSICNVCGYNSKTGGSSSNDGGFPVIAIVAVVAVVAIAGVGAFFYLRNKP